jgi:hypothetical protein
MGNLFSCFCFEPVALSRSRGGYARDTKLLMIAGITRNMEGLNFVQRFPDEIASA